MSKTEEEKGHFALINKTALKDINNKTKFKESDLCFQDDEYVYQFRYVEPKISYKEKIRPGMFTLAEVGSKIVTKETEFRKRRMLTSVLNTKIIVEESNDFFDNLDIYEELEQPKQRKILLFSDPGMGKTAAITAYCDFAFKQDPGTVALRWPTAELGASDIANFLSKYSTYEKECTRMILVMEDIGGGEREGYAGDRSVDSSMLDLLDGLEVTFKLPTLILATTNYPQNLLSALADRPGRFDLIQKLVSPPLEEKIALVEFFNKGPIDERAKTALGELAKDFSIAHLNEAVIRARIKRKHIAEIIKGLRDHKDNFRKNFEDQKNMGFGS